MVALEAAAAAGGGRVLRDEHRMAAVRRLLAVLVRLRGSERPGDEVMGVASDHLHATQLDGRAVAGVEVELLAEALTPDAGDALVDGHADTGAAGGAGTRASKAARRRCTTRFTAISTSAASNSIVASTFTCGGMPCRAAP
jgi:hypothetical protein